MVGRNKPSHGGWSVGIKKEKKNPSQEIYAKLLSFTTLFDQHRKEREVKRKSEDHDGFLIGKHDAYMLLVYYQKNDVAECL